MKSLIEIFRLRNIFLFILYLLNIAFGQFQVSPMVIEHYLENNESGISVVDVRNNTDRQLDLKLYLKDRAYINGVQEEALAGTFERSCADWTFFTPSKLSIDPKKSRSIRINLDVPDSAKGTYWSTLFIEEASPPAPRVSEFQGHKINLNVSLRMGVTITETVPGTLIKNGLVESIYISHNIFDFDEHRTNNLKPVEMLEALDVPEIISNWIYILDDGLNTEFEIIEIPEKISGELRFNKISSPKSLMKVLKNIIAIKDNLVGKKGEIVSRDYSQLIKDLYTTINKLESTVKDKKKSFINFSYYNNGNVITKFTGWIDFRDIDGLEVKKLYLDEIEKIYPMERKDFQIAIPNELRSGEYSALAIADFGGAQLVAGEIIFNLSTPIPIKE